jgi:hypothetical protein
MRFSQDSVDDLLNAWPGLRRVPSTRADATVLEGRLEFVLEPPGFPRIEDCYSVRIEVPLGTDSVPEVFETGRRIPREADHHVNPNGALCLGSPWRVQRLLGRPVSLVAFAERCVAPFLYAATWRAQGNDDYPFAELPHGRAGLLDDYSSMLGLEHSAAILQALQALARHRRDANKISCPCGCGVRLGRCRYRFALDKLRKGMPRSSFRHLRDQFRLEYPPDMPVKKVDCNLRSWRM